MNKLASILIVLCFLIFLTIAYLDITMTSTQQNIACKRIGYNKFNDHGKCLGEETYLEVYMYCNKNFFPTRCEIKFEDNKKQDALDEGGEHD